MNITYIKSLQDNYIWILHYQDQVVIVDPGESSQVLTYLKENHLRPSQILITHEHSDHIDGVLAIKKNYPNVQVIAPKILLDLADKIVGDKDNFYIGDLCVNVLETRGHSEHHLSYLVDNQYLFCGDAMFSAGCGRVFTKDYQAQFTTMQKFKDLADNVQVYCGHEYTLTNLRFSIDNSADDFIKSYYKNLKDSMANGHISLPSTIAIEKKINLFLQAENVAVLKQLRDKRDSFK